MTRATAKGLGRILALPLGLVPHPFRRMLISGLILAESRIGAPGAALKRLFALKDDLDLIINERATALGGGVHPKHRLTAYHDFFVRRIPEGSRVLDVGCGIGEVSRSIAGRVPRARVTGLDSDAGQIQTARARGGPANLAFVVGDAVRALPPGPWDVVVLSNVLEHLDGRVGFLGRLVAEARPYRILVRVPLFERHWQMPLRRELGVDYLSDPAHRIEPTLAEFEAEAAAAGLVVVERQTLWGEIWAYLAPGPATAGP